MTTRTKHRRGNLRSRLDQFPSIVPDGVAEYELAPRREPGADAQRADASQDRRPKTQHQKIALSDPGIDARIDFAEGRTIWLYDHGGTRSVAGLRLRIGPRSAAWVYVRDRVDHGQRRAVYETLGRYDRGTRTENPVRDLSWHMGTDAARDAAVIIAGRAAGGRYRPSGSKGARKFSDAFADYLLYLKEKAEDAGKPARWMEKVARLGNSLILPQWGNWSLAEMSERRGEVADWHKQISKGRITSANHAIRIIRAIYIREARRDDSLSGDPTIRYAWNDTEGRVEATVIGSYTQLPVVHAWASTVHKAQGLTLDDVRIDFDSGAFAPGQSYVALSRARSLGGLSLARPLRTTDVRVDRRVVDFMAAFESDEAALRLPAPTD